VLASADEVFRLPLTPAAVERSAVHVRALPALRTRVPVALPAPRFVGVLPDGATPFTAEPRLPGAPPDPTRALGSIARAQLQGVHAALAAVPPKEARQWGVPGDGEVLLHGDLRLAVLLADGPRLTAVTGWRLRLGAAAEALDPALAALLHG
jgi:aminoglycoside phosphotransferase (APT) family kinase protein